jgi:hypothetical protein
MKHLYIHLQVQEGEYRHDHKVLIDTNCTNLEFAAEYYVAHFWGYGELDDGWWWWNGEHCGRVYNWIEVPEEDYKVLSRYI